MHDVALMAGVPVCQIGGISAVVHQFDLPLAREVSVTSPAMSDHYLLFDGRLSRLAAA